MNGTRSKPPGRARGHARDGDSHAERHSLKLYCKRLVVCVAVLLGSTAIGFAQEWGRGRAALRTGLPEERTGFTFCRLQYTSVRREPLGYGWSTDYPLSDRNFMIRLPELTHTPVSRWRDGEAGNAVVRADEPALFECPFLFASDVGTAGFSDTEAANLRLYLRKGGFLWVDDFWGDRAWSHWSDQIARVLPGSEIRELTPDHPLYSVYYQVREMPQIPSIQFWYRSGGATSERGDESRQPHLRAIFDDAGHMIVLMSHNTDIADGWEREADDEDYFYAFSGRAYGVGINVAVWAMSH